LPHPTSLRLMRASSVTLPMRVAHGVSPNVTRETALVNKTIANAASRPLAEGCPFAHHWEAPTNLPADRLEGLVDWVSDLTFKDFTFQLGKATARTSSLRSS
jgi:hypothetical protein